MRRKGEEERGEEEINEEERGEEEINEEERRVGEGGGRDK